VDWEYLKDLSIKHEVELLFNTQTCRTQAVFFVENPLRLYDEFAAELSSRWENVLLPAKLAVNCDVFKFETQVVSGALKILINDAELAEKISSIESLLNFKCLPRLAWSRFFK
jgi:hypothetical protein